MLIYSVYFYIGVDIGLAGEVGGLALFAKGRLSKEPTGYYCRVHADFILLFHFCFDIFFFFFIRGL